jgi:glycosyltransferase involved in cell wall biosynthesis
MRNDAILYILWNERLEKGLFRSQVIDLLSHVQPMLAESKTLKVLAFVPFLSYSHYRSYIKKLDDLDIKILVLPSPSIFSYLFLHPLLLVPIQILLLPMILWRLRELRLLLIHCRGYPATLLGFLLSRLYRVPYVFDMRSLFPEEVVSSGHWKCDSSSYRLWKKLEHKLISASRYTLGVDPQFETYVRDINPGTGYATLPIAVNVSLYYMDKTARGESFWERMSAPIFVYVGSIGNWNSPDAYVQSVMTLCKYWKKARFLFCIDSGATTLYRKLRETLGSSKNFLVMTMDQCGIPAVLSQADIGLQLMLSDPDRGTRVGVKVIEYLAAGLPVLVTDAVGGAAAYVRRYEVGAIVPMALWPYGLVTGVKYILDNYKRLSTNARQLAHLEFDARRVATHLLSIWINCMSS